MKINNNVRKTVFAFFWRRGFHMHLKIAVTFFPVLVHKTISLWDRKKVSGTIFSNMTHIMQ